MESQHIPEKAEHRFAKAEAKPNQHTQTSAVSRAVETDSPAKVVAGAARSCSPEGTCSPADPAPGRAATDSVR